MRKIISAGSASTNYFVHVRQTLRNDVSVSVLGANEFTLPIPLYTQNAQFYVQGTFGSGSASTTIAIEKGPSANGPFVAFASVSVGPMTTTIPVYHDEVIRVRQTWSSAAAAVTNASVNVWVM